MGMKNPKRLFWLIVIVSVVYLAASALAFYALHSMVELLKYYGISEEAQSKLDDVLWWRFSLILAGSVFLAFSVASLAAGYAVFRGKRWGLRLWYCLVGCFLAFHAFRAVVSYTEGMSEFVVRLFEILALLMVAVVTRVLVTMKDTPFDGTPPLPPEEWSAPHTGDT